MIHKNVKMMLLTTLCSVMPVTHALAQDAATSASDASDDGGLGEVVVTANRREQVSTDVPLSVSVISEDLARAMGVNDTASLQASVPGLEFTRALHNATPAMRGIGSNPASIAGDESAIALYVDGVYYTSPAATLFAFNNIERIEVLKGPQGTLFGRNATGGVVQVITQDPEFTPGGSIELGYANYDTSSVDFYATSGIAENVAADIAIFYEDQAEGWGRNFTINQDVFTHTNMGARSKWLLTPTDRTRIVLSADYYRSEDNMGVAGRAVEGAVLLDGTGYVGHHNVLGSFNGEALTRQSGASVHVTQEFDWATLVSITSYRRMNTDVIYDVEDAPTPFLQASIDTFGETITQELQLLSPEDSRIEWIAGLYYLHDIATFEPVRADGLFVGALAPPPAPGATDIYNEQESASYAAFGQATANLSENTRLTLGARYTVDEREVDGYVETANFGVVLRAQDEDEFPKATYKLALDHRFSPELLTYASVSTGFKSGMFNLFEPGTPPVDPENLLAYEVGIKSNFFNDRLRMNLAAYHYTFENLQVNLVQTATLVLRNAAESESQGIDFDFQAAPFENFTLTGALSYIDSTFTDYNDAQFTTPNPAGGNVLSVGDATGNRTPRSPEWTANLTGQYRIQRDEGDYTLSLTYYYNDGYYWDPDNRLEQPSYNLINASIMWESASNGLSLRLWGKNLLDEEYLVQGNAKETADEVFAAPPLTFGATVGYRW